MSARTPPVTPPAILQQMAKRRVAVESCELCGAEVPAEHQHLVQPASHQLLCACRACSLLFSKQAETRYRVVPDRASRLLDFRLPDEMWDSLLIPVNMAYFFRSTPMSRMVALYPGPAGSTESLLTLESWQELEEANPVLREMQPDVEGLLVNRVWTEHEYFIAPVDRYYELVGTIRLGWTGLSGGTEVWRDIKAFFDRLKAGARSASGERR